MRLASIAALALATGGCTPNPAPGNISAPPDRMTTYRAIGTEPGWSLMIAEGQMRYDDNYGQNKISVPTPQARPSFNGHRYVTPRLVVDITHVACSDGMSDHRYPDTVMITADDKEVRGCGWSTKGSKPVQLAGTRWVITAINGKKPISNTRATTLSFTEDRISGNAGCNSFGGGYTIADGVLSASQMISTRMACPGAAMAQEHTVLAILDEPMTIAHEVDGKFKLASEAGTLVLTPAG